MKNVKRPLVAVVGMSGVFPKATGISQFWHNITHKLDATEEIIPRRSSVPIDWIAETHPQQDKAYSLRACAIDDDIDLNLTDIIPGYDSQLDPTLQWALFATRDALQQCNVENIDKRKIGTILAAIALPTKSSSAISQELLLNFKRLQDSLLIDTQRVAEANGVSGRVVSMPAALIADVFGFGAGAYTLDAACASSLYALKLACDELQTHRADVMVTGGVSGADTLYTQIGFSQLRALSPSGRCAPFDRSADGLVVGEGAGILVLKRLDDALRDDDTIYGVIRGIGLSNDMRGNLLAPESDGQLRAMRSAYATAQWQPWDIDYIECHGAGTPVGDATELKSLQRLWQDAPDNANPCSIGSIKSMIGHLLTGAGAAGLIKTLLGLHHQTLPPSLKFEKAHEDSPLNNSPLRVQTEAEPWPTRDADTTRKAAVSAFGFGGINGHVLLEEWRPEKVQEEKSQQESIQISQKAQTGETAAIAIVGMDVCTGAINGLKGFQQAVLNGQTTLFTTAGERWRVPEVIEAISGRKELKGGFISELALEMGEYKIPPGEIPDILPQQLLTLKVAGNAMRDAGLPLRESRERIGTTIGISFDYEANNYNLRWILPEIFRQWRESEQLAMDEAQIEQWLVAAKAAWGKPLTPPRVLGALGGIVASRIAREFRFGGPSFVVSQEEASGLRAVEIAMRMLQSGETDTMLVGAVDLACDERNLATLFHGASLSASGAVRPFDRDVDGTLPGEGAVALVLKRLTDARRDNDRVYAVINGIGSNQGGDLKNRRTSASSYCASFSKALADADVAPAAISLVETHGSGIPAEDEIEMEALGSIFASNEHAEKDAIAIGATKPIVGHTGAAAGLTSLAKTALCLFHHHLPPMPNFTRLGQAFKQKGPFHFPQQSSFWTWDKKDGPRTACVAAMTSDGGCMHAVLSEAEEDTQQTTEQIELQRKRPLGPLPFGLFICHGADTEHLLASLDRLDSAISDIAQAGDMEQIAYDWFQAHRPLQPGSRTIALVANAPDELQTHIAEARNAVHRKTRLTMGARGGIAYLPDWDPNGQVAFVFPGSGNHYVGMGRRLGAHWPEILRSMHATTDQLKTQMLPHLYDPWRYDWEPNWQSDSYRRLVADPLHCIFGQVVFGGQMTRLLQQFNMRPDAVIPYSLGESAGLFALGAWSDHGRMLSRLSRSDLFKDQLTGECLALKQAWQLTDDKPVRWKVAVVNRKANQVDEVLNKISHVRRLIVNTPNECVIGGLEAQVHEAIKILGCEALFLDGVVTVHCDAALPVAEPYKDLHRFETTPVAGVRFYSCARGEAYDLTSEDAADSIMRQALVGFDFPRTIEQAYNDGVRLFIEIGPQSSCTRMIRQILADKPHMAVAANHRGEDECLTVLKCIGTAAAAGMPIDLAPLYDYPENHFQTTQIPGPNAIRVPVGGDPIVLPPLPVRQPPQAAEKYEPAQTAHTVAVAQDPREETPIAPTPHNLEQTLPHLRQLNDMLNELNANVAATAQAHEQFLDLSRQMTQQFGEAFQLQNKLMSMLPDGAPQADIDASTVESSLTPPPPAADPPRQLFFDREQCLAFAVGSVGKLLGPEFDVIDTYKARVRLPDEPLMLVDRIITVEGERCSMGPGRVVTEHDVLPGAWYLDGGRAPVCISVEAGQADLFLSGYLGIDHQVKGERTYRLLDAKIHFHRGLPRAGETIRYDIHIDKFVKQGATYLFFFRFEGHIGNQHLITMTDGCAGFFTEQEVANSGGIILTDDDRAPGVQINGTPFTPLLPMAGEQYADARIEALRSGDAARCFGPLFENIQLPDPLRLPGGRMRLIDRVISLDPQGGRWGLGTIRAEADIYPDDWFLTCHFVDDKVMPGTLMYECCAHTLRVLLLRMGWVTDQVDVCYEPVQSAPCRLKCRGPVTPDTRHVHYEVELKEIGYHPEPYVVADAHMYADGEYIVFFKDMTMQMSGVTGAQIEDFWHNRAASSSRNGAPALAAVTSAATAPTALFTREHILEFAVGKPSRAFGEPYLPFDGERRIARLPGPPYCFMDRITAIEPEPWVLKADGWVTAEYDMPGDAWYFPADRSGIMPFCVLLEIALQPCGWLAAYAGSALKSATDLKFRNLGGQGVIHHNLSPAVRTLTMRTRITKVSEAADMIIENFDFEVLAQGRPIYTGTTYFGFFTAQALANQIGLREQRYAPSDRDLQMTIHQHFEDDAPLDPDSAVVEPPYRAPGLAMPAKALRMIDGIEIYNPEGGPHGLGFVRGFKKVDTQEWFFKAHFYQDPVCPGSLGVESFIQLVKYAAMQRWPDLVATHRFDMICDQAHEWQYRGQIIQKNKLVIVDALITKVEEGPEPLIMADGWLQVDELTIYKMQGLGLKLVKLRIET